MSTDRDLSARPLPWLLLGAVLMAAAYALYQHTPIERWPVLNAIALVLLLLVLVARALGRSSRALARSRRTADLPTSKIRAAAQGYVELEGAVHPAPSGALACPVGRQPCLWWEHRVDENIPFKATLQRRVLDSSDEPFVLEDDSGRCYVLPEGASFVGLPILRWYGGRARPRHLPDPALRAISAVLLWPAYHLPGRILLAALLVQLILDQIVQGPRLPTTGDAILVAYVVLAMTRFRFRHELRLLVPFTRLYALGEYNSQVLEIDGQAVDALVRPRASGHDFVLSTRLQPRYQRRSRRMAWRQIALLIALVLALGYALRDLP